MKNGVPFRIAFGRDDFVFDDIETTTASIIFQEFDGKEFDWQAMKFKRAK